MNIVATYIKINRIAGNSIGKVSRSISKGTGSTINTSRLYKWRAGSEALPPYAYDFMLEYLLSGPLKEVEGEKLLPFLRVPERIE